MRKDSRAAPIFLLLLIVAGSVHPHPGPGILNSFQTKEENNLFNRLRFLEGKLARMESHPEFLNQCREKNIIPVGIDFRLRSRAAFDKNQLDLSSFVTESKKNLLIMHIQHYQYSIGMIDPGEWDNQDSQYVLPRPGQR